MPTMSMETSEDMRCEEVCALERARCIEQEDGAVICETIRRNCFNDCQ